jgi:hypothetical protein
MSLGINELTPYTKQDVTVEMTGKMPQKIRERCHTKLTIAEICQI